MKLKAYCLIILSCCTLGLCAQQKYSPNVEAQIKKIETGLKGRYFSVKGQPDWTIEERMKAYGVKGLTVAVIKDFKIEWAKGYGWADSAEGRKVTPETIFEPGSISKSLNAFGIMKLVQEGKLDLNADINTYLKSWKFPYDTVSHGKKITLKHLLSHTGGLTVHGFPGYYYGDTFPTIQQILDGKKPANTAAVRSQFEPGLRYEYSGGGTMISELILTDVTGMAYEKYMEENIFKPLGMKNSFFTQPPGEKRRKQLATAYGFGGKEIKGKYPILLEQAAGGLWTTPTDLCKFIIEIQKVLKGEKGKVLDQETVKTMLKGIEAAQGDSVALGFFLPVFKDTRYFVHGAGNQGFRGQYYGNFYDGYGVAIFINGEGFGVVPELISSIAETYGWKDFSFAKEKEAISVPDSIKEKYLGVYREGETIVTVRKVNGKYTYYSSSIDADMHFTSETCFFNKVWATQKCFVIDSTGQFAILRTMPDGKVLNPMRKLKIIRLPDALMDQYAGTYAVDDPWVIEKKNGVLWFKVGENSAEMHFFSETDFYMDESQGEIFTFVRDKDGKVIGFNYRAGVPPTDRLAKRIK